MNFPGTNSLRLTREAAMLALEGSINAQRKEGEDYIRVTDITVPYSGYGSWDVSITTDQPEPAVVELREAA